MAEIKKIYDDAERTIQIYPQTHERAVVDNNGTTAETKFQMITDLVNQKQMEIGAVPIDLTPTIGNTTHVVSSDGIARVTERKEMVKLTNYPFSLNTSPQKVWGKTYTGIFIPVVGGDEYEFISSSTLILLPLKALSYANEKSYESNIATGYSDRIVETGGYYKMTIPSDCTVVFVQTSASGWSEVPQVFRIFNGFDSEPTTSSNAVESCYFNSLLRKTEPLTLSEVVKNYYISSSDLSWHDYTGRDTALYNVTSGDYIHLVADNYNTNYAFLSARGTISHLGKPLFTSGLYVLSANESVDVRVPENSTLMYIYRNSGTNDITPKVLEKYTSSLVNIKALADSGSTNTVTGAGMTAITRTYSLGGGKIYSLSFYNGVPWAVSTVSGDNYVVFGASLNGTQIIRITKGEKAYLKQECQIKTDADSTLQLTFRADSGVEIKYTLDDVTNEYKKKLYDIYFVTTSDDVDESMMVKVNQGDLVKYSVNASASMVYLKAYNRADRESTYLVDSLAATEAGTVTGTYMPTQDCFIVIESVTSSGFTPSFSVWTIGNNDEGKIIYPYQLIFDTDNKFAILSPNDEDASIYDNQLINYGQIIPANGMYYLLYQGFGTYHSQSSNILMAYSQDGINWTRGIPQGIEAPISGTNVIFNRDNTQYIANEFVGAEVVNEFGVAVVDDNENKYRMFCAIRNDSPNTIKGECHYLLKSNDLVHWTAVRKVDLKAHDSFSCVIPYGDKLKVYLRMWDYSVPLTDQRMIGVMWLDIWGNVLVPASGIFGHGLYNSGAVRIGSDADLLIPSHFYVSSGMSGDNSVESYIIQNGVVRYAPSYNIDKLRDKGSKYYSGWNWSSGLVGIGVNQYVLYGQRSETHSTTFSDTHNQLRLCPVHWVTYNSYNKDSD